MIIEGDFPTTEIWLLVQAVGVIFLLSIAADRTLDWLETMSRKRNREGGET